MIQQYPKGIGELEYKPGFAIRSLHYDIKEGILMKIDLFHQIQYESVYRGLTPLARDEVEKIYGGSYIPQYMIRAGNEVGCMLRSPAHVHSFIYLIASFFLLCSTHPSSALNIGAVPLVIPNAVEGPYS